MVAARANGPMLGLMSTIVLKSLPRARRAEKLDEASDGSRQVASAMLLAALLARSDQQIDPLLAISASSITPKCSSTFERESLLWVLASSTETPGVWSWVCTHI